MENAIMEIVEEMKKLRTDFNAEQQETRKLIEEKFSKDQEEKAEINGKIEKQDGRIYKLENGTRKRNVIVYGLTEETHENFNDLKQKIDWLFNTKMEMGIKREEIDEFFRLGKKNDSKRNRPIIVKMISSWRKTEIMMNKRKLKGTMIFIENDMNEEEMKEKRNMVTEMKDLKSKGHDAYIRGKSLIVNNVSEAGTSNNAREKNNTTGNIRDDEATTEEQDGSNIGNTTIYQTPLNTPGKRNVSQRSPEKNTEFKLVEKIENAIKKKKIVQLQRNRSSSEGQKTLDSMIFRRQEINSKSKIDDQKNDSENKNIGYASFVYDPSEKEDNENNKVQEQTTEQTGQK
uniref:Uncharacterized protein n=1 Tax=Cacopsylla melanoneura TaxID=428564 RepID=A0A8D9ABC9_9HEMI